jgi:predicted metal-dependent phosphoesterase TrpH/SAM-dependent methyltransferase
MKKKVKVELHVHTKYSYDCTSSFHNLIEACKNKHIDVLGVADHNEIRGAFRLRNLAPFKVLIGQEILTSEGEVVGFFLKESIDSGLSMEETIRRIKRQGGISYLPHPLDMTTRKTSVTNLNLRKTAESVDIIEVHNGRTIIPSDNKKALNLANENQKIMGVGSDAHTIYEIGRNYLEMDDFETSNEFLQSLQRATLVKSTVMPWIFLVTKWQRFKKKQQKTHLVDLGKSCDLCGETECEIIYKKRGRVSGQYLITDNAYGEHEQIVKCLGCELYYAAPREDNKKLIARYQEFSDPLYEKEHEARSANQAKIINNLRKLGARKGKLLDVGCATGGLLEQASSRGFQPYGIELSDWAVEVARKRVLNVLNKTIDEAGFKRETFDIVTCIDVIEHVDTPRELVENIKEVLKTGGLLCIVTPDRASFVARLLGEKWWHIRNDHIYYFSEETLCLLVESLGFEVLEVKRYGWSFSFDYWVSRLENKLYILFRLLMVLKAIPIFGFITNRTYSINFGDSLELYCRKA